MHCFGRARAHVCCMAHASALCLCVPFVFQRIKSHTDLLACRFRWLCLTSTPLYRSAPAAPTPGPLSALPLPQPPRIPQPLAAALWSPALPWRSEDFTNLLPRSSQGTSRSRLSLQESQLPKWLNTLYWNLKVKMALRKGTVTQWTWMTRAFRSVMCEMGGSTWSPTCLHSPSLRFLSWGFQPKMMKGGVVFNALIVLPLGWVLYKLVNQGSREWPN